MTTPLKDMMDWMTILIEHKVDAAAGARTKAARRLFPIGRVNAGEIVIPNDRMTVYDRLEVYNGGYFVRLRDVLESDFPALIHALGDHAWHHLVLGYLSKHPSRHPNLNVLNRQLPTYIAGKKDLPNRAFLRDLGELEVRITMAFDAPEFTPMDMDSLLDLSPEQWEGAVFTTNPSLQLLASSYPVNKYLQAVYDDGDPELPPRKNSYLAIYRTDYKVWRLPLPRPMFQILSAIADGRPFAEALGSAGSHSEDIQRWFQEWSGDGLFTAIKT